MSVVDNSIRSISVTPNPVVIGTGFSIPFNEAFDFDTARATDIRTEQLLVTATLSSGSILVLPFSEAAAFQADDSLTFGSEGLVSILEIRDCGNTTQASIAYDISGTRMTTEFEVRTACLVVTAGSGGTRADPFVQPGTTYDGGFVGQFRGPDTVDLVLTTAELKFSLKEPTVGLHVDESTGEIRVDSAVPVGTKFVIVAEYFDPVTEFALTSEIEFQVGSSTP